MDDDETNIDEMAARSLREFLRRCFHSVAVTLEWRAQEAREEAERRAEAE